MVTEPNWEGRPDRECGDHRTVGPHGAWCFDCTEWCHPKALCKGCELTPLRPRVLRPEDRFAGFDIIAVASDHHGGRALMLGCLWCGLHHQWPVDQDLVSLKEVLSEAYAHRQVCTSPDQRTDPAETTQEDGDDDDQGKW